MHDTRIAHAVGTLRQGGQPSPQLRADDCAACERGRRFMRLLDAGRVCCGESPVAAVPVPVLISEPPPAPASAASSTARGMAADVVDAAAKVADQLLIGTGPSGALARLRFGPGAGALAGVEIELRAAGGVVELRVASCSEGGRRALVDAISQVATKLRARGVLLRHNGLAGRSSSEHSAYPGQFDHPSHFEY